MLTSARSLGGRSLCRLGWRAPGLARGYRWRTRVARSSELVGLGDEALLELLERGTARLAEAGIHPRVFAPPFNRFEARQYGLLAQRYDIVCGGPETVPLLGFHRTPLWRGGAIYMPAYAPFYGRSDCVGAAVDRAIAARSGLWIPLVLHWSWEARDDWSDLSRLVRKLAGHARPWDELLAA